MQKIIRIGTRESQLAVWQATKVKELLAQNGIISTLVYIKSEGDIDLHTPLYEMGVQGIFTKSLDTALLNNTIDVAVHSMKDVPTQLPKGIIQSAVLKRDSYKDILVYKAPLASLSNVLGFIDGDWVTATPTLFTIATSSIRRKAQWLHRYPNHSIENLRGNVLTRLQKLESENWHGAIFAAAGLERIHARPQKSIALDWMLPAPAQGAIMVVCRQDDAFSLKACMPLNDVDTAVCTKVERDFLRALLGGCSTPISALATMKDGVLFFEGNIVSVDGKEKISVQQQFTSLTQLDTIGKNMAEQLLKNGADKIIVAIRHGK